MLQVLYGNFKIFRPDLLVSESRVNSQKSQNFVGIAKSTPPTKNCSSLYKNILYEKSRKSRKNHDYSRIIEKFLAFICIS